MKPHTALWNGFQLYVAPNVISCHVSFLSSKCILSWETKWNLGQLNRTSGWNQTPPSNLPFPFTLVKGDALTDSKSGQNCSQDFRICKQAECTNETYCLFSPSPTHRVPYFLELFTGQLTSMCENWVRNITLGCYVLNNTFNLVALP